MMFDFRDDPPPAVQRGNRRGDYDDFRREARANPGRWGLLRTFKPGETVRARQHASAIRCGSGGWRTAEGRWEARVALRSKRPGEVDGRDLWVRYSEEAKA
jgi:hypothetical protein